MKRVLQQSTYSGGFNDRDDPNELDRNQVQSLVNARPGNPAPSIREGTYNFNDSPFPGDVSHLFEFHDDVNGDKVIAVVDRSFYWADAGSLVPTLIGSADILPVRDLEIYHERVFNSLYIVTNWPNSALNFILEWSGNTFSIRSGNIERPETTIVLTETEAEKDDGFGGFVPDPDNNLEPEHVYSYAVTFANMDDPSSIAAGGSPLLSEAYVTPILESGDDINERKLITTSVGNEPTAYIAVDVDINIGSVLDPQATHALIYRTEGVPSSQPDAETEAKGLPHRFLAAVPVKGPLATDPLNFSYTDKTSDESIAGSLFTVDAQVGKSGMPSGNGIKFHNGILWIGGLNTSDLRGRWYYSSVIEDGVRPLKFLSNYDFVNQFIDTSLDESEKNINVAVSQNDIYFVMEKSIYYLRDGDVSFSPKLVDASKGSRFPRTVTEIDRGIYYLSNEGPARIFGRNVDLLNSFTAGTLWPETYKGPGDIQSIGVEGLGQDGFDTYNVLGFYYKNSWFITHRDETVGHYISPDNRAIGPWKVEFGSKILRLGSVAVFDDDLCVFVGKDDSKYLIKGCKNSIDPEVIPPGGDECSGANPIDANPGNGATPWDKRSWRFLTKEVNTDNMTVFKFRSKSRAMYVRNGRKDYSGEAFDIKIYAKFTDFGELRAKIFTNFVRHVKSFIYTQQGRDTALQNQTIAPSLSDGRSGVTPWRTVLQQGFQEGIYGHFFEIEIEKNFFPPFDFYYKGFDLNYIDVGQHQAEFVSITAGFDDIPLDSKLLSIPKPMETLTGVNDMSITSDEGSGIFTVSGEC